eukprot:CAMPEP_0177632930 /NCGR_PEP_ID=MMETSP0447-20121125/2566_1 /TAXON_ID=0 /ORGANISM="Stygamoeba regulata, Strain BSH-02190019" /LENGTH=729 /DNA_ID=CAMNT_0019134555 /DNA_START=116 /DNA_END=2302 /DNA_ORIENTATION=+
MGNYSTRELKQVFAQLDTDGTGKLSLSQLLKIKELPGIKGPITHSPSLFFEYDSSGEGSINFDEFCHLIKDLQKNEERLEKELKHRKGKSTPRESSDTGCSSENDSAMEAYKRSPRRDSSPHPLGVHLGRFFRGRERVSTDAGGQCWETLNKETIEMMKGSIRRGDSVPSFVGTAPPVSVHPKPLGESTPLQPDLMLENARAKIAKALQNSGGRNKYMNWLYRLADVDHSGHISQEELHTFLNAISEDGIQLNRLVYGDDGGAPNSEEAKKLLARRLMEEFDTGKTGFLTKDEFMVLADLVIECYGFDDKYGKRREKMVVGDYELRWKLGVGSYSTVYMGVNKHTKEEVAVKIIKKGKCSELSRIDVEIQAMLMLDHPHVVKLHSVFENADNIYFIMDLCGGGNLSDYVSIKPLSEDLARYYMKELVDALRYCHSQGVCHRDLKIENLLLDDDGELKITDFGQAGIFSEGWDIFSTTLVGSLMHISPEQVAGLPYSGEKIDAWALGVVIYRLICQEPPFYDTVLPVMIEKIKSCIYTIPEFVSPECRDLLLRILQADPADRMPLDQIANHPWFLGKHHLPSLLEFEKKLPLRTKPLECIVKKALDIGKKLGVVMVPTAVAPCKLYRCFMPKKELKFSVNINQDNNCLECKLQSGHTSFFWEISEALAINLEKLVGTWEDTKEADVDAEADVSDSDDEDRRSLKYTPKKKAESHRRKPDNQKYCANSRKE